MPRRGAERRSESLRHEALAIRAFSLGTPRRRFDRRWLRLA